MIDILGATYILGALFFGVLFGSTAWKLGGFQAYADAANKIGGKDMATSNMVQWYVVLFTLLWPLGIGYVALMVWISKRVNNGN